MAFWNKKKQDEIRKGAVDLSDVIKGMQHAVNEASRMLEMHNLRSLKNFFHDGGEAKSVQLHLEGESYLEVPVLALSNHNSLMLDKLSMEFEAKIDQVELKDVPALLDSIGKDSSISIHGGSTTDSNSSASFSVSFAGEPKDNALKVRMEFSAASQPEGLSRVIDEYNKLIVPHARATQDNPGSPEVPASQQSAESSGTN